MGVLIAGMEMPKRGMVVNIYADGRVTNHFDEFGKTIGKAVPVPEPHGRLIDADVLCNRLEIASRTSYEMREAIEYVAKWIVKYVPTVIPASEEVSA